MKKEKTSNINKCRYLSNGLQWPNSIFITVYIWAASSEFGTYRLCEQRRFRRACASAQSRQNLCCSLIQAVSQEAPSDRKPDPCPLWMAGHAQLKFVMTKCSKTQIRLTHHIYGSLPFINKYFILASPSIHSIWAVSWENRSSEVRDQVRHQRSAHPHRLARVLKVWI